MKRNLQFVNWFPEWKGFGFRNLWKKQNSDLRYIYDWLLWFGFWEIRKWHFLTQADREELG